MSRSSAAFLFWCCCSGSHLPACRSSSACGTWRSRRCAMRAWSENCWCATSRCCGAPCWRSPIGYSAFIAEVFRAGIQSVDKGQIEAAKALGLSRFQRFRLVVFPQAIRTILPPLGNDFVAMVKDSSLVSVLGVADITQMGKIYAAGLVPLLRDLFDRRLYLPYPHRRPVAGAARTGTAHAAGGAMKRRAPPASDRVADKIERSRKGLVRLPVRVPLVDLEVLLVVDGEQLLVQLHALLDIKDHDRRILALRVGDRPFLQFVA